MDVAFKIVNSIRARALQRHLFKQESEGKELLLHTDVRWLSSSKFFKDSDIYYRTSKHFFTVEAMTTPIDDLVWMNDLAFLADFTGR